jgi:hypothetical protein
MDYRTTCTRAILPPQNKKGGILDSSSGTKSRIVSSDGSEWDSKHPDKESEFVSPPRQLSRYHSYKLNRKRSFSVDLRFSPKNEEILRITPSGSRRRANTTECENLIGTTISFDCFGDSNKDVVECENSSGSEINETYDHHPRKGYQEGASGTRFRRRIYAAPATPSSMDIECGKCFAETSSESPTISSSNHRQTQTSVWIKSIQLLMSVGMLVVVSSTFGNVLVETSTSRKLPSHTLDRTEDIMSNIHTVKNFGEWGLTLEDEEPVSYIEEIETIPEQTRKKRRPMLSAANNLASQQWNTHPGVYVPKPAKLMEFVMTDDEITKKTALLNDENYKIQENKYKMDMVCLFLTVAFLATCVFSVFKQFRYMSVFTVHSHSK